MFIKEAKFIILFCFLLIFFILIKTKKETKFIGFGDLIVDVSVGTLEKNELLELGFNDDKKWISKLKNEKLFEDILKKNKIKFTTGGSLLNTFKTLSQANEVDNKKNTILFTSNDIKKEKDFNDLFKVGFKNCNFLSLNSNSQNSIIKKIYIIFDKDGERYFYSSKNSVFPIKTVNEWNKILKKFSNKNYRIVVEGYLFYDNIETFVNLIEASNKLSIPVDFLLSNSTRLKEHKNIIINLIEDKKISMIIGNDEEFKTLFDIYDLNIDYFKKYTNLFKDTTFIITMGVKDTLILDNRFDKILSVPVKEIKNVVNTNGAGDGFLAGFYYYLSNIKMLNNGKYNEINLIKATEIGHKIASVIVKMEAPNFKDKDEYIDKILKKI